jgi:hypothetical protein
MSVRTTQHNNIVELERLVSPTGSIVLGATHQSSGAVSSLNAATTIDLGAGDAVAITGAQILNGFAFGNPGGMRNYTSPTYTDIAAAFTAANKPLAVGDFFSFTLCNINAVANTITLTPNVTTPFANGGTTLVIPATRSAQLIFQVTSTTAMRIFPICG